MAEDWEQTVLEEEQLPFICLNDLFPITSTNTGVLFRRIALGKKKVAKAQAKATWKAREPEIEQARKAGYKQGVVDANKCGQDDYQAGEKAERERIAADLAKNGLWESYHLITDSDLVQHL